MNLQADLAWMYEEYKESLAAVESDIKVSDIKKCCTVVQAYNSCRDIVAVVLTWNDANK